MKVLICAFIFFTGLYVFFGCVSTDNPSPMFDIGFVVGFIMMACSGFMMLSYSWVNVINFIPLLFQ